MWTSTIYQNTFFLTHTPIALLVQFTLSKHAAIQTTGQVSKLIIIPVCGCGCKYGSGSKQYENTMFRMERRLLANYSSYHFRSHRIHFTTKYSQSIMLLLLRYQRDYLSNSWPVNEEWCNWHPLIRWPDSKTASQGQLVHPGQENNGPFVREFTRLHSGDWNLGWNIVTQAVLSWIFYVFFYHVMFHTISCSQSKIWNTGTKGYLLHNFILQTLESSEKQLIYYCFVTINKWISIFHHSC